MKKEEEAGRVPSLSVLFTGVLDTELNKVAIEQLSSRGRQSGANPTTLGSTGWTYQYSATFPGDGKMGRGEASDSSEQYQAVAGANTEYRGIAVGYRL